MIFFLNDPGEDDDIPSILSATALSDTKTGDPSPLQERAQVLEDGGSGAAA